MHWPFCQAKCPYCDFNSHVVGGVDQEAWRDALAAEVRRAAERMPGREVRSVFFGGGTPSLMHPATVARVLDAIASGWHLSPDAEITLEANPTSVEAQRFRGYRDAGVNRLSLGVQSLDDRDLARLGRLHSAEEARAALAIARKSFPSVSADLIYARQDQDVAAWRRELGEVLALGLDHLSLYQLTIEDGTAFGDRHSRGTLRGLPGEDLAAELYTITQDLCEDAGLPAYEVSNHARTGRTSRHNLVYWRAGDWVGVGPGAIGRATVAGIRMGSSAPRAPDAWLRAAGRPDGATEWAETGDHGLEYLMMAMRLTEGISQRRLESLGGEIRTDRLQEMAKDGYVEVAGDRIAATASGRIVLEGVLRALV